ncbi:multi-sensor hybrid histidine kinase [Stylonychia lemnae]|uniref:histidine kinase n=1 Tax=Stylonychia lemnae TaxID=5949 RepID=A0A078A2U6_STYLE|nr:multi-sensor hybrid histidine kinase [Stylonychia lemnae]|eukprot:CDW76603.1 multi-sensor hybrid histidine kinase [Stylonychia lemnae]
MLPILSSMFSGKLFKSEEHSSRVGSSANSPTKNSFEFNQFRQNSQERQIMRQPLGNKNDSNQHSQIKRMVSNVLDYQNVFKPAQPKNDQEELCSSSIDLTVLRQKFNGMQKLAVLVYIFIPLFMSKTLLSLQSNYQDIDLQRDIFGVTQMLLWTLGLLTYFTIISYNFMQSMPMKKLRLITAKYTNDTPLFNHTLQKLCRIVEVYILRKKPCTRRRSQPIISDQYFCQKRRPAQHSLSFKAERNLQQRIPDASCNQKQSSMTINPIQIEKLEDDKNYDRFDLIKGGSEVAKQKSTGNISQKVRTQEDNIKAYFEMSKPTIEHQDQQYTQSYGNQVTFQRRQTYFKGKDISNKENKKTNATNNNDINQNLNAQNPNPQQQYDDFNSFSSLAINSMMMKQELNTLQTKRYQGSPNGRFIDERITEKNEDDDQSDLSLSQESDYDQMEILDQIKYENGQYKIQVNDKTIQGLSPFTKSSNSPQFNISVNSTTNINLNTNSFGTNNTRDNTSEIAQSKNRKRIQLKDLQRFHSQDHSESIIQSQNKLAQKLIVKERRQSNLAKSVPELFQPIVKNSLPLQQSNESSSMGKNNQFLVINHNEQDQDSNRSSKMSSSPTFTLFSNKNNDQFDSNFFIKKTNSEQHTLQRQKTNFKVIDIEMGELYLKFNKFSCLYLFGFYMFFIQYREYYLQMPFVFQLAFYTLQGYISDCIIINQKIKKVYMVAIFSSFQFQPSITYSFNIEKVVHVIVNSLFLFMTCQGINNNHKEISQRQMTNEKLDQIIKSDQHLKNLVQLIPYGIAVLNLEDVSHFNHPFGKVLGVKNQKQVIQALTKFQRKIKEEDQIPSQNHARLDVNDHNPRMLKNKKLSVSNLKEDLEYILKNKEIAFKEANNIFDIYYIDKDEGQRLSSARGNLTTPNQPSSIDVHQNNQAQKIYSISISPITWGDKECLLLTVKDITHEKIIDQKQLMDRLKNMIFKSFSHELKTPLNGIIISLETSNHISKQVMSKLRRDKPKGNIQIDDIQKSSKSLRQQLKIIESCSYVLKNIMHDFFDYHQLQTNELSLNVKEFDLKTCIKDITRIVKHQIKFDKVKFKSSITYQNKNGFIQDNIQHNIRMTCDKDRLQQILLNLLMNSIKFTNKGFIELQVYVKHLATPQMIQFKVRDSGIGIESERLPYIFNLFEKNENSNFQQYLKSKSKSARMGLPISQNLCNMMGGHIVVKSLVGQGSTFTFHIPLIPHNQASSFQFLSNNESYSFDNQFKSNEENNQNSIMSRTDNSPNNLINVENLDQDRNRLLQELTIQTKQQSAISRKRDQDEISSEGGDEDYRADFIDEDFQKHSSKDLIWETSQKLGQFELVFNSPNQKNFKIQQELQSNMNANLLYYDEEEKSTPKLNHYVDQFGLNDKSTFSPNRIKQIKSNDVQRFSSISNIGQFLKHNLKDVNQEEEKSEDSYEKSNSESLTSEQLKENQDQNQDQERIDRVSSLINSRDFNFSFQHNLGDSHKQSQISSTTSFAKNRVSSLGFVDCISSEDGTRKNSNKGVIRHGQSFSIRRDSVMDKEFRPIFKKEGSQKDYLMPLHSYIRKVETNLVSRSFNSSFVCNKKMSNKCILDSIGLKNQNQDLALMNQNERLSQSQIIEEPLDCILDSESSQAIMFDPLLRTLEVKNEKNPFNALNGLADSKYLTNYVKNSDRKGNKKYSTRKLAHLNVSQADNIYPIQDDLNSPEMISLTPPRHTGNLFVEECSHREDDQKFFDTIHKNQTEARPSSLGIVDSENQIERIISQINNTDQSQCDMRKDKKKLKFSDKEEIKDGSRSDQIINPVLKFESLHSFAGIGSSEKKFIEPQQQVIDKTGDSIQQKQQKKGGSRRKPLIFSFLPNAQQSREEEFKQPINPRQKREKESKESRDKKNKQDKQDDLFMSPVAKRKVLKQNLHINANQNQSELNMAIEGENDQHQCPQILIVDDVQMNRFAIEKMLLLIFGIKVLQAENGQESLEVLMNYYLNKVCECDGIKIILMDIEMPVMDGITATYKMRQLMRENLGIPDIPIIALTAYLDEKDNCLRAGMRDFMVKPTSKGELQEMLQKYQIRGLIN